MLTIQIEELNCFLVEGEVPEGTFSRSIRTRVIECRLLHVERRPFDSNGDKILGEETTKFTLAWPLSTLDNAAKRELKDKEINCIFTIFRDRAVKSFGLF